MAKISCNIMTESKNIDAGMRIREINDVRGKIGAKPFLESDKKIIEGIAYGLCKELVLDDDYAARLAVNWSCFNNVAASVAFLILSSSSTYGSTFHQSVVMSV